jgi:quinol monooxygenase YgiN
MKMIRIVAVVAGMVAGGLGLHLLQAQMAVNASDARALKDERMASDGREEQSRTKMANEKVIMLIEAKIQPERRAELVEAARQYVPRVRAEAGVEGFYLTTRKDDPNAFVFFEVYKSQAAQDFHLQQDFVKKFLALLKSAQVGERARTSLVEVGTEGQAHSN